MSRWLREKKKNNPGTPRTKINKLLSRNTTKNRDMVKKTLLFHTVLVDEIKAKYRNTTNIETLPNAVGSSTTLSCFQVA